MNCLCGYKHLDEWEIDRDSDFGNDVELKEKLIRENGKERFINLGIFNIPNPNNTFPETIHRGLYACPRCMTVQLDK